MSSANPEKAVIYCRTAMKNSGIEAQEKRCRGYAAEKGFPVAEVFLDDGASGNAISRPGLRKMLDYLVEHPDDKLIVITEDIQRISRNTQDIIHLHKAIDEANAEWVMTSGRTMTTDDVFKLSMAIP